MSLITTRNARSLDKYTQIDILINSVNTSDKYLYCNVLSSNLKRLVVGMTILANDGTTSNKIVEITNNKLTMRDSVSSISGGNTITFTTADVKEEPLTNQEIDENFLNLEKNKLDATGNQFVEGNVEIRDTEDDNPAGFDEGSSGNLYVSNHIIAKSIDIGGLGDSTATFTTDGDIQVNNIKVNGEIDDRSIFEKYSITKFNQHLLCEYTGVENNFLAYSILFLDKADGLTAGDEVEFNNKRGQIIEVFNGEEKYIYVKDLSGTASDNYLVGSQWTKTANQQIYTLKKFLKVKDYLKPNQLIKIFGVGESAVSGPVSPTISKDANAAGASVLSTNYEYKALTLNRRTGKISSASSGGGITISNVQIKEFDETSFNRINITRNSSTDNDTQDLAVLLYRKAGSETQFHLVGIVDNSMFGSNSAVFSDFGNFIINQWSGRSEDHGKYTKVDLEYIPKTYEDRNEKDHLYDNGYQYVRIHEVNDNTFTIRTQAKSGSQAFVGEQSSPITGDKLRFFHNNSVVYDDDGVLIGGLQKLINDKKLDGTNSVTLPSGTYHTGLISIPSGFQLKGESRFGTILKLPPLDDYSDNKIARANVSSLTSEVFNDSGKNYANTLIGLSKSELDTEKHNISIENLTIDGNFINRFLSNDTSQQNILGDALLRAENINTCLLRGLIIKNAVGGGIYAPNTKRFSLENSDILDNSQALKDSEYYTPLHAIACEDINITNNKLMNGSSSVELSNTIRGSLIGNVVKNTSSGVITYGSTNLITTPNLILGPNNEYLGTTDTLDSEFDSINVDLFQHTSAFESLSITFSVEGEKAYLAEEEQEDEDTNKIPGSGVKLSSKIHTLAKQGPYEYFIDDLIPVTNSTSIISFPSTNREDGNIKFRIEQSQIDTLRDGFSMVGSAPNLRSEYNDLSNQPLGQSLVGLGYQINATEFTNLTNSNDHIKFLNYRSGSADQIIIEVGNEVDLSDFIVDREVLLSINSSNSLGAGPAEFINIIEPAGTDPDNYKVCKVVSVNSASNEVTLEKSGAGSNDFNVSLTNSTDNNLVGFKNTFLIAKGRILV